MNQFFDAEHRYRTGRDRREQSSRRARHPLRVIQANDSERRIRAYGQLICNQVSNKHQTNKFTQLYFVKSCKLKMFID